MLWVKESFVNETKGYRFGDSDWYESSYEPGEEGRLYRTMQREYGRCQSAVYVDTPEGSRKVGWYFVKRMKYEDARDNRPESYYLRGVWVSVAKSDPIRRVDIEYAELH